MKIDRVEVLAVGPEVQRVTWFEGLPEQFMTNTVVRIYTDDGLEGVGGVSNYTSYDFDRYTIETLRHMIPALIGLDPLDIGAIWDRLWTRVFPLAPQALGAIDVALWDLKAKHAGLPLYRALGGQRQRIPAYASTPLLADVPTYLRFIDEMIDQGFRAVKFHCWCVPDKDRALIRAVRRAYPGDEITFMLDAENSYAFDDALEIARELSDLGFEWLEAPLWDADRDGYRRLNAAVDVDIIPAGNWIQDQAAFRHAAETGCWSRARTDVTIAGGFTPARRYHATAAAAGLKCEVLSWGNTLVAAANLHLMLSDDLCSYFEQAVPYAAYEYGMFETIRTGPDGYVNAPQGPGLGFEVDWPAMEKAAIHRLDTRTIGAP